MRSTEMERALIELNDRICSWERDTGRKYTLILIPHQSDDLLQVSQDGKPLREWIGITLQRIVDIAISERGVKDEQL